MKNTKDNSCTANTLDWNPLADLTDTGDIAEAASPFLETEDYTSHTKYDALNRPISLTTPDGSVNLPTYNEAGLLDKVQACLRGASVDDTTPFVTNINYDAKGQRELVRYANGVYTEYTYDPLTFRVIRIRTIRTKDNACLQDLNYTYDPVGNITELRDNAQKTIFYDNARVEPVNSYEYDALYRLIHAEGREHAGQDANAQPGHHNPPIINTPHPNDAQAMRNYTEDYVYDEVGNILCMDHNFANGGWKRNYQYENVSNRLESTSLPGDDPAGPYSARYNYDAHGNMTRMLHLPEMCWDFKDQMCQVDLDGGGTACYIYDAGGQRARKVHEHNGSTVEERIYLGGYEIYRKHNSSGLTLERETLHIMDDQQRIALLETKTVENGSEVLKPKVLVQYQLNNHLGSSSLELDGEARVISYEEYYPYGSTSYQAVNKDIKAAAKRYRYTGKERDDETGLYYYGARYYAAWLGRWTSTDPAGLVDGLNLYKYTSNNPIRFIDLRGTQSFPEFESTEIAAPKPNVTNIDFKDPEIITVSTSPQSKSDIEEAISEADEKGINIDFLCGQLFSLKQKALKTENFEEYFSYNQLYSSFAYKAKSDTAKGYFTYVGSMIAAPFAVGALTPGGLTYLSVKAFGAGSWSLGYYGTGIGLTMAGYGAVKSTVTATPTLYKYFSLGSNVKEGILYGGKAGVSWVSGHPPGPWSYGWGPINTLIRILRTGSLIPHAKNSTMEIPAQALPLYERVSGLGLFRLLKHLGKQYQTTTPGNVWLNQGVIAPASAKQWTRFFRNQFAIKFLDPFTVPLTGAAIGAIDW